MWSIGPGAGAGAAETFYTEPESEPEPFKTFDQLLYDVLLMTYYRKIFCDIRSLSFNRLPTTFFRTIIFFTIFCLRYFATYDIYLTILYLRPFHIR